jgi:hypothetical protein
VDPSPPNPKVCTFDLGTAQVINTLATSRFRLIREAHAQLNQFMNQQVIARKNALETNELSARSDAFSLLVKANEEDAGKLQLNDQELVCLSFCKTGKPRLTQVFL